MALALAVLSALIALPSTASAAQKGLVTDLTWGDPTPGVQDHTVAVVRDSGAQWVLMTMNWSEIEKSQGTYDEARLQKSYDSAINLAHQAGLNVIVSVTRTPDWAGPAPAAGDDTSPPDPSHLGDFAAFMNFVAARYAGKVQAWEIWNEENYHRFWSPTADGGQYADMLKAASPAVKAGDSNAKVVFGGMRFNDTSFLEAAYAHVPDLGNYFDVMGIHPYVPDGRGPEDTTCAPEFEVQCPDAALPSYRNVHDALVSHGDDAKPLWFTELGWSDTTNSTWGVSQATVANYLTRAYKYVEQDPYVQLVIWYELRNNYWMADADDWGDRMGLLQTDFSPKPAYAAFKAYGSSGDVPSGSGSSPPASEGPAPGPANVPSAPAPLVKQPTSTTVSVSAVRASLARSTRRIVGSFTATGRVRNANGGLVRLAIQHRSRRGYWHNTILRTLRLDRAGRVATRVRTNLLGRWRIRATYQGSAARRSSNSSWRYLTLAAPRHR